MIRKNLNADYLYSQVKNCFGRVPDHRTCQGNVKISMTDALMSGLAVFALKKPSLLSFERDLRADNPTGRSIRNLFSIDTPASDTQMRAVLDPVEPGSVRAPFRKIFSLLQRGGALEGFGYLDEGFLLALDGTGHFSSGKVKCNDCIEKKSRSGEVTYHHKLLGASVVHPELKQVVPLCPEAVSNGDGETKQDCELKAAKRWLAKFRAEHPKLDAVILGDALFSNAPFVNLLGDNGLRYILGVKPDGHKALFGQFELNKEHGLAEELHTERIVGERVKKKVSHAYRFLNGLSLNDANPDIKVNVLEYEERTEYADPADDKKNTGTRTKKFTWITDIELTGANVEKIMRSGRARWKVENETFQTLKSECAYNLEHSYGHGKENLCTIFGTLAMLAFLIDQAQEIACPLFRKALEGTRAQGTKRELWGLFKSAVEWLVLDSWETLLKLAAGTMEAAAVLGPAPEDTG